MILRDIDKHNIFQWTGLMDLKTSKNKNKNKNRRRRSKIKGSLLFRYFGSQLTWLWYFCWPSVWKLNMLTQQTSPNFSSLKSWRLSRTLKHLTPSLQPHLWVVWSLSVCSWWWNISTLQGGLQCQEGWRSWGDTSFMPSPTTPCPDMVLWRMKRQQSRRNLIIKTQPSISLIAVAARSRLVLFVPHQRRGLEGEKPGERKETTSEKPGEGNEARIQTRNSSKEPKNIDNTFDWPPMIMIKIYFKTNYWWY